MSTCRRRNPDSTRTTDDSLSTCRHLTRTARLNRRLPNIRDFYRHRLSPVIFTLFFEAVLHDLWSRLPIRPPAAATLPLDVEYADDTDLISSPRPFLDDIDTTSTDWRGEE